MQSHIKLSIVLSEIDRYEEDGKLKTFSLTFVSTKGKLIHRKVMSKGGEYKKNSAGKVQGKSYFNVKEKRVLVLWNEIEKRTETPKIALITHFNGERVWH